MNNYRKSQILLTNYDRAKLKFSQQAYNLVVAAAREIVESNPDVDEFIMGMGSYCFSGKRGGKYDFHKFSQADWDSDRIKMDTYGHLGKDFVPEEFFQMVEELDEAFGVTGNPIRFKAGMKPIFVWGDTINPLQYEPLTA